MYQLRKGAPQAEPYSFAHGEARCVESENSCAVARTHAHAETGPPFYSGANEWRSRGAEDSGRGLLWIWSSHLATVVLIILKACLTQCSAT